MVRERAPAGSSLPRLPSTVYRLPSTIYFLGRQPIFREAENYRLFEGPFKAIHVDRESYLLHLCRYIHANPVRHGLVSDLERWPYSNYLEWIGARDGELGNRSIR